MKIAILLAWTSITAAATAVAASSPPAAGPSQALKPRSCIPLDQVIARRTVGSNAVEFDMIGGVTYRNEFEKACPGIERLGSSAAIAITNAETGTLCAGDRVKIFDPAEIKATGLRNDPFCRLGSFAVSPPTAKR